MTGTPDAETAWQELVARYPRGHPSMPDVDWAAMEAGFKAGFAAAEGPWREHLAQAWDEGYDARDRHDFRYLSGCENPYRLNAADEFQNPED